MLLNNNLQFAGAQTKAKILTHSQTIQMLQIYDTTMGFEGAKLLCQETINSSVQKLALQKEYHEWMVSNHPHLAPWDRVIITNPPLML